MRYMRDVRRVRRLSSRRVRTKLIKIIADRLAIFLALVGAIFLLFSQLSMLHAFSISRIVVNGNESVTNKQILAIARENISGHYFGLFSKSNILLYSRSSIENDILGDFTRIASVYVDTRDLQTVVINIAERKPAGVWCSSRLSELVPTEADPPRIEEGVAPTSSEEERLGSRESVVEISIDYCYFLDETGFVYSRAPTFTEKLFFEFMGEIESDKPLGEVFLNAQAFAELNTFIDTVNGAGVETIGLDVVKDDRYELIVEGGARIIFDPNDGYETILENLSSVLASNEFRTEAGDRLIKIEYIDLRFGNKVFYRLE